MYDIYTTDFKFEECRADKEEIKLVVPYAVLHFVVAGEGYVNGKKITGNTVFISFENTWLHYYPSRTNPWHYVYIRLDGNELKKAFTDCGFDCKQTITQSFYKQKALFQLLSFYQEFSNTEDNDLRTVIANSLLLLFKENALPDCSQNKQKQHVAEIKRFIEENYYKKITIEGIASKFYLNKNYVRTLFVKYMNISPKQYLQHIRMLRAKFLLSSTNEDIAVIATSVGYKDSLLFSKMFKEYFHISPKQFRAQAKNKTTANN